MGALAQLSSSKRILAKEYKEEGIPFYRGSEISNGGTSKSADLFISREHYEELKSKYGVPIENDLLITAVGTLGNIWKVDNREFYYKDGNLIQLTKLSIDIQFLYSYLSDGKGKEAILDSSAGSNQKALTMVKLRDVDLIIPLEKAEQTKIGSFIQTLDNTIALHQRKLEKLNMLKKAYLQQLFPQADEKTPRLRFVKFNADWEQRKLGKVVQINMGQSPKGETYTVNPSDYILVQGNTDMKNGKVYPRLWTTQVTKTAEPGDIILSVRAPVGDVGKTDYNVVLGRGVAGIKGNEFIYQTLARMKLDGFWTRYSTGSTFESINSNDLKDALVSLPSEQEQIRIGAFLKEFDKIIVLHQQKIDTVIKLKKAFLQKIFI